MSRPIAGVAGLQLEGPSVALGVRETDEQLRDRAKMAISAAGGGTEKALTDALMAVPIVKAVQLRDATDLDEMGQPVVPPGELEIVLDAPQDQLELFRDQIAEAIETHKGPGILARVSTTKTKTLSGEIVVKPASDALTGGQMLKLVADCEEIIKGEVAALPIGGTLVWNRLLAKLMNVENLADVDTAKSGLSLSGAPPALADVTVGPFERMILGEGVEAVAVLPDARPLLTVGLTATPGIQTPAGDAAQGLEDALVSVLSAHVDALNAAPVAADRKIQLSPLVGEINAPGVLSAPVAALPIATLRLTVTDLAERSEVVLQDGGPLDIAAGPEALITLAEPPITLVWEPESP
jgi:hypothetical protein